MSKKLGLIQSRGIGDIIIALPIAKWYHDRGNEVYWPIDGRFLSSFCHAVPYVRFIPFRFKPTADGFLNDPKRLLRAMGCEHVVTLYSFFTNTPSEHPAFFASLKFDEYKYAAAGVPFREKWNLSIRRHAEREQSLFNRLVRKDDYIVVHRHGSDAKAEAKIPPQYAGHQVIEITEQTECIFDWLLILERAKFLLLIDSCFSNLVDQLGLPNDKMFILRSEVRFTPVLRSNWQYYGEANPPAIRSLTPAPSLATA
jgi:hypothetical protein